MLAKEKLDFVTVATSDHLHADLVVNSANAGVKGILCEKPLATTISACERMLEACVRNKTVLAVDHTRRYMPYWQRVKALVDEGIIGPVQNVVGVLNGPRAMLFGAPDWVFAELESGYENYTEYRGDGGHLPESEPSAHGYIHFSNSVRGIYIGGPKTTPPHKMRLEIVGTDGVLMVDEAEATNECRLTTAEQTTALDVGSRDAGSGIGLSVRDVINAVENNRAPQCTGLESKRVVDVMLGFLESQRLGNVRVNLPLDP